MSKCKHLNGCFNEHVTAHTEFEVINGVRDTEADGYNSECYPAGKFSFFCYDCNKEFWFGMKTRIKWQIKLFRSLSGYER